MFQPPTAAAASRQAINIQGIIQRNAIPALLGFLQGKTEAEYHHLMRQRPDFVTYYRQNNPGQWNLIMATAPAFRSQINAAIIPEIEAKRVVWMIKQKGWKCYRSEYQNFVDNIRLFLACINGQA